jgi:hypothetical protein
MMPGLARLWASWIDVPFSVHGGCRPWSHCTLTRRESFSRESAERGGSGSQVPLSPAALPRGNLEWPWVVP